MTTEVTPLQQVHYIDSDSIIVNHERFRKDVGDVQGLADSIKAYGLFSPIILDENNELAAGFRRLSAMRLLGWTKIPYFNKGELSELQRREIELEENIRRKAMHWLEEQKAIVEIDRLRKILNPNWSQDNTAVLIGKTSRGKAVVSEAKVISEASILFPEIAEAKSKKQALSWARSKLMTVNRTLDVADKLAAGEGNITTIADKIILGDSVEVIKTLPAEMFHAVITDPPFGIDYDGFKAGKESQLTAYEDSKESYERLLSMADDLYRVIKPNGWLVWFHGMSWYGDRIGSLTPKIHTEEDISKMSVSDLRMHLIVANTWRKSYLPGVKTVFRAAGFTVDELPIIWDRTEGRCHTNRPDRYFARGYDVAVHCFKGEPEIVQRGKPNVLRIPPVSVDDRHLTVERPPDLYAELIRRLTVKGEIIADFFVGSGACPLAAQALGRDFFGVERDPDRRSVALMRLSANAPK